MRLSLKAISMDLPIFRFLCSFTGAGFLFLLLSFFCFNFFSLAEAKNKTRRKALAQQEELNQTRGERFRRLAQYETKEEWEERKEWKARGVIVRFHRWPSVKEQKEIAGILRASGLKRTKSLRSFKAQLFGWIEGGLEPSKQGEGACLKLKSLSYVRRCSPDHLLPLNSVQSASKVFFKAEGLSSSIERGYFLKFFFNKFELFSKLRFLWFQLSVEAKALLKPLDLKIKKAVEFAKEKTSLFFIAGLEARKSETKKRGVFLGKRFIAEAKQKKGSETEGGFVFECEDCKNQAVKSLAKVSQKALNIRTCGLISDKRKLMNGSLSDYWAQELIGSDLLREQLEKTPAPDREDWIAVFDSQQEDHNIAVKNLISDEALHAVLPKLGERKIPFLETKGAHQSHTDYRKGKGYKPALSVYETSYPGDYLFGFKKRAPHYINNSMGWGKSQDIYEVFEKLSSSTSNTVIVSTSGNDFPLKLGDIKVKASKNYNVVLAGSFSPKGFVSEFSQSGKELHILAPSDDWITSAGQNGEYIKFSGTSGAAPLITGSLAGFEWLSGYHPTAKEAKILLEKTALPTLHSHEKPRINGAGLLNAYKLGEVAKRLKEKCEVKSISCFKQEILKNENYRFSEDRGLKGDIGRVFPSCSGGEESRALSDLSSCEEKGELFKRLRKRVLLSPEREYLESLSCIYKEAGFSQNAESLDKLSMALGTEEEVRAELRAMVLKEDPISRGSLRLMLGMGGFEEEFKLFENKRAIRMASGLGEAGLSLLEKALETGKTKLQWEALYSAGRLGEAGLPLLEKALKTGKTELQKEALFSAGRLGEASLPLLEKGFETGKLELQKVALYSAGLIGETGLPLLEKGFETGKLELQLEALYSVGRLGEASLPLLEKGFETGKPKLQKRALYSAGRLGEAGLPLLEKGFETGKTELQKKALYSAGRLGEAGLPLLEKGFETGKTELQKQALSSARLIGEAALPLLEKGFETGKTELQKQALYSARLIGEAALPLLEKGFETGKPELQKEALSSASGIGEAGLPLLEKGFETGKLELQKQALDSAGRLGEASLPLLEKGFETGKPELQKQALYSAGRIGEAGLPLLEKGFKTGNLELQLEALDSAGWIGEEAVPLLKRVLKNKDLDEDIRIDIEDLLEDLQ